MIRPKEISYFGLGERESKYGQERREKKGRRRRRRLHVWNSGMDTWFRTLYLVYGLGLGTPKLISCRVELREL